MSASGSVGQWLADLALSVSQTDPKFIGVVVTTLVAGAAFSAYQAWRNLCVVRLIEDTPAAKIRSAPQGYVEIVGIGRMMDGPPIIAKVSGLPCVWYRYKIEELASSSNQRNQQQWKVIDKGESTETFWLADDTGRIVIDPEGAEVSPRYKDTWKSRSSRGGIGYPVYEPSFSPPAATTASTALPKSASTPVTACMRWAF